MLQRIMRRARIDDLDGKRRRRVRANHLNDLIGLVAAVAMVNNVGTGFIDSKLAVMYRFFIQPGSDSHLADKFTGQRNFLQPGTNTLMIAINGHVTRSCGWLQPASRKSGRSYVNRKVPALRRRAL